MKRRMVIIALVILGNIGMMMGAIGAPNKKGVVTFNSLLNEMIDKDAITQYPDPYYTFIQFSSYDRRSTAINDSTWFANSDSDQFIREEEHDGRKEYVLMETDGPGAIVRFWLTGNNHGSGMVRIYLDGEDQPVIEEKLLDFISKNEIGAPLSSSISPKTGYMRRGHNLYFPIPYAKGCKVTYEWRSKSKDECLYYCINARAYENRTKVESYTKSLLTANAKMIQQVNEVLSNKENVGITEGRVFDLPVGIGEEKSIKIEEQGAAVSKISVRIKGADLKRAYRDIILKCSFDNEETIWCPIGDFFGTGYELHPSQTYYTKVEEDGSMSASWIMPFQKDCKISFENIGKIDYRVVGDVVTKPYEWTDNSMYFHCTWKQFTQLSTGDNKARIGYGGCFDMNFVTLTGKGVYVGDAITLFNTSLGGHWKSWWGEGDEKVYLDGESFPSIIGTGTEDYYGYAWCEYNPFNHPYLSQPIGGGNFKFDMTVNMRYRGLDAMPFSKSLKFDMEMWHWTKTKLNFAPTTFFYMLPGGEDNIEPDYNGAKAKLAFGRFDILIPEPENGLLEGENLRPVGQEANTYGYYGDEVSGGVALIWNRGRENDYRTFEFYADNNAQAKEIALQSINKNGIYEITVNGEKTITWDSNSTEKTVELTGISLKRVNQICFKLVSKKDPKKESDIIVDYLKIK